ncbi:MAG: carboxypeptidase-like regulatory domain-containing protein [Acidimicrobiales bacterium]
MRRLLLLVLVGLATSACTSGDLVSIPDAPQIPATTTSTIEDFSAVALAGVPGRTTTSLGVGPGDATLNGAVVGPAGPVAGALVRAERLVGDAVVGADVLTKDDGTWALPAVLGGRYRLRAWRAPDLALIKPEVFYLNSNETKAVNLPLTQYTGLTASADVAPSPPPIDESANLAVQVSERSVDDQGVVRGVPRPALNVEVFGAGDWQLQSANPTTSDVAGIARFRLVCRRAGEQPLSVVVADSRSFTLDLPPCSVPPPDPNAPPQTTSTTSTTIRSTTTTSRSTTTTARSSTTTSTTRPTTSTTLSP